MKTRMMSGALAIAAALAIGACDKALAPAELGDYQDRLRVVLQFPRDASRPATEKIEYEDIDTIVVAAVNLRGEVVGGRAFAPGNDGWDFVIGLPPVSRIAVHVEARSGDAVVYSGVDTAVSVAAGGTSVSTIPLMSHKPVASMYARSLTGVKYAVIADPRNSRDPRYPADSLRVRYDWESDGSWDTGFCRLVSFMHVYPVPGTYTVTAEVRNPDGVTAMANAEVTVEPVFTAPDARLTVTPAEGAPGTYFTVDATGSVAYIPMSDSLAFRWDWEGDGKWDTPWLTEPQARVCLTRPGAYMITLEAKDAEGQTSSASIPVIVRAGNRPPTPHLVLSCVRTKPGQAVVADASGTVDGGGGPIRYRWSWGVSSDEPGTWSENARETHRWMAPGTYTVRLTAMNGAGDTASVRATVVVESTEPRAGTRITVSGVPMVYVPAGSFPMGDDRFFTDEVPRHRRTVRAYLIDEHEVTNAEYARFVTTTGHRAPAHWVSGLYTAGQDDHPVVNVSWDDAVAYARWRGCRLPTEAEWEYAARGDDARLFPWGNAHVDNRANWRARPIAAVATFTDDRSPFGAYDMAGNVREWTNDLYEPYPGFASFTLVAPGAHTSEDLANPKVLVSGNPFAVAPSGVHMIRGNGVRNYEYGAGTAELRVSRRDYGSPELISSFVGFRCVRDID